MSLKTYILIGKNKNSPLIVTRAVSPPRAIDKYNTLMRTELGDQSIYAELISNPEDDIPGKVIDFTEVDGERIYEEELEIFEVKDGLFSAKKLRK